MHKLARLFYDLSVYKEIVMEKFRFGLLRYSVAYLCLSFLLGFWINQKYLPGFFTVYQKISTEITQQIPQNGQLELKNGTLTTMGLTTPYIFTLPSITSTPILYINPQADLTALASTSAIMALGQTHMRTLTDIDGTYEVTKYSDQKSPTSISITSNDVFTILNKASQFVYSSRPYLPLLLTLPIFCFLWFGRIVQTLMYALILKVLGSLFNSGYRFIQYWQLTLHTIIVAELINTLILVTYSSHYSFVFTIAFIGTTILAFLNLPAFPKTETPSSRT